MPHLRTIFFYNKICTRNYEVPYAHTKPTILQVGSSHLGYRNGRRKSAFGRFSETLDQSRARDGHVPVGLTRAPRHFVKADSSLRARVF
jgi:hypothetical protein